MRKLAERYEKTFIEKYDINSVEEEIEELTKKNKNMNEWELYQLLPYLGMLYIPINSGFRRLLPNNAVLEGTFCPVKVTSVDEEKATIYEFDDHERWWNVKTFVHINYLVKGNQLILAPYYEAKLYLVK